VLSSRSNESSPAIAMLGPINIRKKRVAIGTGKQVFLKAFGFFSRRSLQAMRFIDAGDSACFVNHNFHPYFHFFYVKPWQS
jgi:hypothetical protein